MAAREHIAALGQSAVVVCGATGPNAACLNGVFEPAGELHNGRPLYQRVDDPNFWLRYTKNGFWMVSDTAAKDANNVRGYNCSVEIGLALPTLATEWKVWQDGKWVVAAGMTATVSAIVRTRCFSWSLACSSRLPASSVVRTPHTT